MPDVFVSYSRRDSDFVHRLTRSIGEDLGKEVWLDTEGIAAGEVFPDALKRAIEESDTFLFVITPESVSSSYCEAEVAHAVELNKRILPVLRTQVADEELPPDIRFRNWIQFADDAAYDGSLTRLSAALDHDLDAAKAHTRWLVKAREWDERRRDRSLLLRGAELKSAEAWLAVADRTEPVPTALQRDLVRVSRQGAARRQRALVGASTLVAIVSVALLVFALISRSEATRQRDAAERQRLVSSTQALTAESQAQLTNDPMLAVELAARAVRQQPTPADGYALRQALDTSTFVRAMPNANISAGGDCGTVGEPSVLSPDGRDVAAVDCHGLRIMDVATGRVLHRLTPPAGAVSLAYRPDGAVLAVGTGTGVTLVDARTGAVQRTLPGIRSLTTLFSPDGSVLVTETPSGLTVYRAPSYTPTTWANPHLVATSGTGNLGFGPGGRSLFVAGDGNDVYIYDVATGAKTHHRFSTGGFESDNSHGDEVAISADGSSAAVAYTLNAMSSAHVAVFSTRTWAKQHDITSLTSRVSALAFGADGTRLAIGTGDGGGQVWTVGGSQLSSFEGQTGAIASLTFDPHGTTVLASSDDGTIRVWRTLATAGTRIVIPTLFSQLQLRGGTITTGETASVATDHGVLDIGTYRTSDGVRVSKVAVGNPYNSVYGLTFSNGGRLAFVGGAGPGKPASLWDLATRRVLRTLPVSNVFYPVFDPTGRYVVADTGASEASGGTAQIIDITTGRVVTLADSTPCGPYNYPTFGWSANGEFIAGSSYCGDVTIWNLKGQLVHRIPDGAGSSAAQFDINPDGSKIVVATLAGATIYSTATAKVLHSLVGHVGGTVGAAFSPDGSKIMTTGNDDTLRLWSTATGDPLRILTYGVSIGSGFSVDGKQIFVYEFQPGRPTVMHVLPACPGCGDPDALVAEATAHDTDQLTPAERKILDEY